VGEDRKEERGKGARGLRRLRRARPDWAAGTNAKRVGIPSSQHQCTTTSRSSGQAWTVRQRGHWGEGGRRDQETPTLRLSGLDVFWGFLLILAPRSSPDPSASASRPRLQRKGGASAIHAVALFCICMAHGERRQAGGRLAPTRQWLQDPGPVPDCSDMGCP
jgi:hypothetical protein